MPRPPRPDNPSKTRLTPLSQRASDYGTAIRQAREEMRYSERDLTDELGMSQTTLNKLENGRAHLTVERLEDIAQKLGKKPVEIIKSLGSGNHQVTQTSHDQSVANGVVYHPANFEPEREVWKEFRQGPSGNDYGPTRCDCGQGRNN